ncbi:other 1 protein kinase [Moniliophthora roreri]|nr:other 1 protein kinase [Moniliophthora roreri]
MAFRLRFAIMGVRTCCKVPAVNMLSPLENLQHVHTAHSYHTTTPSENLNTRRRLSSKASSKKSSEKLPDPAHISLHHLILLPPPPESVQGEQVCYINIHQAAGRGFGWISYLCGIRILGTIAVDVGTLMCHCGLLAFDLYNDTLRKSKSKPNNPDNSIHSTPQNCGIAGLAEYSADERICFLPNLEKINIDMGEKESSSFVDMLKALLARMLMSDDNISTITADLSSDEASKVIRTLQGSAAGLYDDLISSAIDFCNKDLSTDPNQKGKTEVSADVKLCREMKESIREYCKASTEAERYKHLVSALNTVLCNFRSHKFKDLMTPAELGDSELIFVTNDPAVIVTQATGTERKPDIIATSPRTLENWFGVTDELEWTKLRDEINEGSKPRAGLQRGWLDVLQPWVLNKSKKLLRSERLEKVFSEKDLTEVAPRDDQVTEKEDHHTADGPGPGTSSRKRRRESETDVESTSKRQRTLINNCPLRESPISNAQYANASAPPLDNLCSPDMQLAYYALERLCVAWNITHTTGIILQDTELQLWYYDSQGCIQTHYIDILQQLPLFVVMVMIFQRFNSRMWGVRDTEISCPEESKTYYIIEDTTKGPRFELCGRRPFTAHVSEKQNHSQHPMNTRSKGDVDAEPDPSPEEKFFKAAWPDTSRNKEPAILDEAHRRADELLQEPLRSYVKDHIPIVNTWRELSDTSTALIRCFLGLSTENGQVQLWMTCPILEPARKLAPQAFWVALWEAIRCHYILWHIGVAHGDISLSNIMYREVTGKCILNDFDLATLMDPGTEVPDCKGYECTGTRPFMALDLPNEEGVMGHTQRRYRHDLESFCWVLVWVGACVQDGQEELTGRFEKMVMGTHNDVYKEKLVLLMKVASYATTGDYATLLPIIRLWLIWWRRFYGDRNEEIILLGRASERKSAHFINECFVQSVRKARVPNFDVPIEIDWLSVDVPASLWRQYQERHALGSDSS